MKTYLVLFLDNFLANCLLTSKLDEPIRTRDYVEGRLSIASELECTRSQLLL